MSGVVLLSRYVTERWVAALRAADCSADSFSMTAPLTFVGFLRWWAGGGRGESADNGVDWDKLVVQGLRHCRT
jgi:hypothetical protein